MGAETPHHCCMLMLSDAFITTKKLFKTRCVPLSLPALCCQSSHWASDAGSSDRATESGGNFTTEVACCKRFFFNVEKKSACGGTENFGTGLQAHFLSMKPPIMRYFSPNCAASIRSLRSISMLPPMKQQFCSLSTVNSGGYVPWFGFHAPTI